MDPNKQSLDKLKADITRAREWARKRFNAYVDENTTPSTLLDPPTCMVEFDLPDHMTVTPVFYGKPMGAATSAEYTLCWKNGKMYWKGNFVIRKALYMEGNVFELEVI